MRWKHQNYIVVSGRRPREEKMEIINSLYCWMLSRSMSRMYRSYHPKVILPREAYQGKWSKTPDGKDQRLDESGMGNEGIVDWFGNLEGQYLHWGRYGTLTGWPIWRSGSICGSAIAGWVAGASWGGTVSSVVSSDTIPTEWTASAKARCVFSTRFPQNRLWKEKKNSALTFCGLGLW